MKSRGRCSSLSIPGLELGQSQSSIRRPATRPPAMSFLTTRYHGDRLRRLQWSLPNPGRPSWNKSEFETFYVSTPTIPKFPKPLARSTHCAWQAVAPCGCRRGSVQINIDLFTNILLSKMQEAFIETQKRESKCCSRLQERLTYRYKVAKRALENVEKM